MVKLNLNLLFIHYYIKIQKIILQKRLYFIFDFFKNDKVCWAFLCCVFLIPYLFFSLFSSKAGPATCGVRTFSYSDLNLVNEALSVTPLFVYDNIEDKKAEIWKDNKGKSGVYRWINTVTGSSYVGSSAVLNRRIKCYLDTNYLKTYKHKSVIYSAILKYGLSVFRLEILEHCAKEDVTLREQFYLDTLKPTYNILKLAGSSLGFKHSYSTIVQMKERNNKNHPFLASFFFFRSLTEGGGPNR